MSGGEEVARDYSLQKKKRQIFLKYTELIPVVGIGASSHRLAVFSLDTPAIEGLN